MMKTILIIGLGRFGQHIAKKLNDMNHQVMAVDQNEERVNTVLPFVTSAQIGDSTNEELHYEKCMIELVLRGRRSEVFDDVHQLCADALLGLLGAGSDMG